MVVESAELRYVIHRGGTVNNAQQVYIRISGYGIQIFLYIPAGNRNSYLQQRFICSVYLRAAFILLA